MESVQQNYIGGTWVPAGATAPNVNPSNLNDVVANYARPLFLSDNYKRLRNVTFCSHSSRNLAR